MKSAQRPPSAALSGPGTATVVQAVNDLCNDGHLNRPGRRSGAVPDVPSTGDTTRGQCPDLQPVPGTGSPPNLGACRVPGTG